MKVELDETTSDGIQFLLIGAGSLLVLRLMYVGISLWLSAPLTADLPAAIAEFRNGYWISDPNVLVVGGSGIATRLAMALVLTVVCTVCAALIVGGIVRAMGGAAQRMAVRAARFVLPISLVWWMYVALMLPPETITLSTNVFIRTERHTALGELSVPWSATESEVSWSEVESVRVSPQDPSAVEAVTTNGTVVLTRGHAMHAARLAELLRASHDLR